MSTTQHTPYWVTYDKREIDINKLDDQHLSNIYWFSMVFYGGKVYDKILIEISNRNSINRTPLPWKPLPIPNEISEIRSVCSVVSGRIIWKGQVIGSIAHIEK